MNYTKLSDSTIDFIKSLGAVVIFEEMYEGLHYLIYFPNNHLVSVIKHRYSYGSEDDLFEVAIEKYNSEEKDYKVTLVPDILDAESVGYAPEIQIMAICEQVSLLRS